MGGAGQEVDISISHAMSSLAIFKSMTSNYFSLIFSPHLKLSVTKKQRGEWHVSPS